MLVSDALTRGQIRQHYKDNFVPLPEQQHSHGRKVYINAAQLNRFNDSFKNKNSHFGLNYLYKQIWTLKGSGFLNSLFNSSNPMSRTMTFEGGEIVYAAVDGDIYIEEITITGALGVNGALPAGVYRVRKVSGSDQWEPAGASEDKINEVGVVNTKHLAISGYSEDINDAASYMPAFIEHGFGKETLGSSYSLFYTPAQGALKGAFQSLCDDLGGKRIEAAKKLATVFEHYSGKKQELYVTVHGGGHNIFRSALKEITKKNVSLENVTAYYANATTNLQRVDRLRQKAKMKLCEKAPLINTSSLQQQFVSGNIVSAPVVAIKAKPEDAIAITFNSAAAAPLSISAKLATAVVLGSSRSLERKAITTAGHAVQEGTKLIWSNVHKMMVHA